MNVWCILLAVVHCCAAELAEVKVTCDGSVLQAQFRFNAPFTGVVYALDHYTDPTCRAEGNGSTELAFPITIHPENSLHSSCGLVRRSAIDEVAVMLSMVKGILVAGSQQLLLQCQYDLRPLTLSLASLSMRWVTEQRAIPIVSGRVNGSHSVVPENISMVIRRGHGFDGQPLHMAGIGEEITLDIFFAHDPSVDVFVHNCIAHDGHLNEAKAAAAETSLVTIVDRHGCASVSSAVTWSQLTSVVDESGVRHIFLPLFGFQFYTSDMVIFECQIQHCDHNCIPPCDEDKDADVTPPANPFSARRRRDDSQPYSLEAAIRMERTARLRDFSLHQHRANTQKRVLCLSESGAILLAALLVSVAVLIGFALLVCWWRLRRSKSMRDDDLSSRQSSITCRT